MEAFALRWAQTIRDGGQAMMGVADGVRLMRGLTARLARALGERVGDLSAAHDAGAALVRAHLTSPEALRRSVTLLAEHLLGYLYPGPEPTGPGPTTAGPTTGAEPRRARPAGGDAGPPRAQPSRAATAAPGTTAGPADHAPGRQGRLAALLGALAAGYAEALRERTRSEQERARGALVAAQAQAREAFRVSEARFRAVFAGAGIGIGIADVDGRIVEVNQALGDMLGLSPEQARDRTVDDFAHPDDPDEFWVRYHELVRGERENLRGEKALRHSSGRTVWTEISISLIRDEDGTPRYTAAMIEDVTCRRQLQEQLRYQATHDMLTRLPNRAMFLQRLSTLSTTAPAGSRVGVCVLDLDGFKSVNDSLGHHTGDQLLVAVATRLTECLAGTGHLVARMGGDEFGVLVAGSSGPDELSGIAASLLAALSRPVRVGAHLLTVSASIGVVERPVSGSGPAELLKDADVTLYWAKADGKGRWALFDQVRNAEDMSRYALCSAMPGALERREFVIAYQPLVRLRDRRLVGVEALVRWRHPRLGLLPPLKFIELAEDSGLIVPLGRWILEDACRQARRWQHRYRDARLFVSVNLSVLQVREPGLVDDVARVLCQTGLDVDLLQLELTESTVLGPGGRPLSALRRLADMGIRIAIDDFGTGYSNLAYLRNLPVHGLKLAGPFVAGLARPEAEAAQVDEQIVATLINLAHTLDLDVTAEGVETVQQAERLCALGCDIGQGWHFARAVPPEQIDRILASGRVPRWPVGGTRPAVGVGRRPGGAWPGGEPGDGQSGPGPACPPGR